MNKFAAKLIGNCTATALTLAIAACGNDNQSNPPGSLTTSPAPLDIAAITSSIRTDGNNLVVGAGWFDCHQQTPTTPTTCTGEQPVEPKDNDAFDEFYESYSDACQQAISRTNYRLDMAKRVRPWIVDNTADQVTANIDEKKRVATAEIKQTDGSTIVMHFDFANGRAVPQCKTDGTLKIEKA